MIVTHKRKIITLLLLAMVWILLTACGADEISTATSQAVDTPVRTIQPIPTREVVSPEAPPTEEVTVEGEIVSPAELEPSPTPLVVVDEDSACVDCHTNTDQLKALAKEPEEVHLSLSLIHI